MEQQMLWQSCELPALNVALPKGQLLVLQFARSKQTD